MFKEKSIVQVIKESSNYFGVNAGSADVGSFWTGCKLIRLCPYGDRASTAVRWVGVVICRGIYQQLDIIIIVFSLLLNNLMEQSSSL